jgi:hypothetical protein
MKGENMKIISQDDFERLKAITNEVNDIRAKYSLSQLEVRVSYSSRRDCDNKLRTDNELNFFVKSNKRYNQEYASYWMHNSDNLIEDMNYEDFLEWNKLNYDSEE